MWDEPDNRIYVLSEAEKAVLQRSARERELAVADKAAYSKRELVSYGLIREAFTAEELSSGIPNRGFISSHDPEASQGQKSFGVGSPHPSKIAKWQLPLEMFPYRPVMIIFPPGSKTAEKVQPAEAAGNPGGALRVVLTGRLYCNGVCHEAGDWFFVENGTTYEMCSHPEVPTQVLYLNRFVSSASAGRFSYEAKASG